VGKQGRSLCQDVTLHLDLVIPAAQLHEFLSFNWAQWCLLYQLVDAVLMVGCALRTQLRMLVMWQPNSLAKSPGWHPA